MKKLILVLVTFVLVMNDSEEIVKVSNIYNPVWF